MRKKKPRVHIIDDSEYLPTRYTIQKDDDPVSIEYDPETHYKICKNCKKEYQEEHGHIHVEVQKAEIIKKPPTGPTPDLCPKCKEEHNKKKAREYKRASRKAEKNRQKRAKKEQVRRIDCLHYSECLDEAVALNKSYFSCAECEDYECP